MAALGVDAIAKYIKDGTKPTTTPGLDFYDTGVSLVTDQPQPGADSIDAAQALQQCWGDKG
jgi:fructose transport system substrate-binding protein